MNKVIIIFAVFFLSVNLTAQNFRTGTSLAEAPFFHGVASGDPLASQVMIWTKVTPPN